MRFYGWIPHLDPDLDCVIPDVASRIRRDATVPCDDESSESMMRITMIDAGPGHISGQGHPFEFIARYGPYVLEVGVLLETSGLMTLSIDEERCPGFSVLSAEDRGRKARYIAREVYFEFKRSLHSDVHHSSDRREGDLNGPDELMSVTHGDKTREQGIEELATAFIRKARVIDAELGSLVGKRVGVGESGHGNVDYLVHEQYRLISGYIVYARNFVEIFMSGSERNRFLESLDAYRMSADTIYSSHVNDDMHELTGGTVQLIETMNRSNRIMSAVAVCSAAAAVVSLAITVYQVFFARWRRRRFTDVGNRCS